MATVTRQDLSESYEQGAIPSSATVRYLVEGAYTAFSAVSAVQSDAVAFGDPHPDSIPGDRLRASRFRPSERVGAGADRGWFVDVIFTLDGSGANFEEPTTTEPDYVNPEMVVTRKEIEIPIFVKKKMFNGNPAGGVPIETFRWERDDRKVQTNGITLRITVNVGAGVYNLANFSLISAQSDKVHQFGGRKWQFIGANSSQVAADVWRLTYEWYADPGNAEITGVDTDKTIVPPARGPFQDYRPEMVSVVVPGSFGAFEIPTIEVVEPLEEDLTGWTSFPIPNPIIEVGGP